MQKRVAGLFLVVGLLVLSLGIVSAFSFSEFWNSITGNVAYGPEGGMPGGQGGGGSPPASVGPSAGEQACMMSCMGCSSPGVGCTGDSALCQKQCNAQKPESTPETSCMESCVLVGCGEFDFSCQNTKKESCEKECNMIKEPEAKSEEERCIRDCVNAHSPGERCGASQTGETGGEVCQMCAQQCVHLYAGPCLDDAKMREREKECMTCPNCYASPVLGDSGEGWECVVAMECKDASSEFGDNPGTGPGIGQEGFVANVGDAIGNVFENIGDFFSGLFGGGSSEEVVSESEEVVESSSDGEVISDEVPAIIVEQD